MAAAGAQHGVRSVAIVGGGIGGTAATHPPRRCRAPPRTANAEPRPRPFLPFPGSPGLVLAHALRKRAPAIAVTVYDRDASPTARSQGYEIGLNADGLAGLDAVAFPALEAYLPG